MAALMGQPSRAGRDPWLSQVAYETPGFPHSSRRGYGMGLAQYMQEPRIDRECRDVRPSDPGRRKLRPEGEDDQDPQGGDPINEQIEGHARSGIAPMHVLEHHQQGVVALPILRSEPTGPEASSLYASVA